MATGLKLVSKNPAQSEFCSFETALAPVRIHMKSEVIERLAQSAPGAEKRPGGKAGAKESGGILLGKSYLRRKPTIEIHDFEPFPAEGNAGNSYYLSSQDKKKLEKVIAEKEKTELAVVGLYRTHLRERLAMEGEELSLFRTHFPDPANVALLVRPESAGGATGTFFFWEDGALATTPELRDFPLDRQRLGSGSAGAGAGANTDSGRAPARRKKLLVAALAATLLVAGGGSYLALRPSKTGLELKAERTAEGFAITWNRGAALLNDAQGALFTIQDGKQQRQVQLDVSQLRNGTILYPVNSGQDVQFRLDLFSDAGSAATETLLVAGMGGPPIEGQRPARAEPARPAEPAVAMQGSAARMAPEGEETGIRATAPDSPPEGPEAPSPETAGVSAADVSKAPQRAAFQAPAMQPRPTELLDVPEPLAPGLPVQDALPRAPAAALPSELPAPAAQPAGTAAAEPAAAVYVPPRPRRQARPAIAPNLKKMIPPGAEIEVRLQIDATGKVVAATPIGGKGQVGSYLAALAAEAAEMWEFEPARSGDQKVPSETTIRFRF
ncbi:MAG: hypothetical protein FJW37_00225 [Acidobacteria bacterium]|nr:hypothetical protein [Acidobacteriota bacterium]